MREWGRIKVQFWTDAKIQRLTDHGKLLFVYFLSGPHANGIGCFRLPFGYIEEDMEWVSDTVTQTLSELLREGLVERCEKSGWTLIANYLKHNPIDNPNVAKGAIGQIQAVPSTLPFYPIFIDRLKPYAERFPKGFIEGLRKGMPNGIGNIEKEIETEIEIETEKEKEDKPSGSDNGLSLAEIDIEAALKIWNDLAAELQLAHVQKLTEARKAKLKARLHDTKGIAGWADVLIKMRDSRFLRGENERGWRADFDFVLQESSFTKLREGAYSDRKTSELPIPIVTFKLSQDIVIILKSAGFTDTDIKTWFDDAEFFEGGKHITVKSNFVKDWISDHYDAKLRRAFGDLPLLNVAVPSVQTP